MSYKIIHKWNTKSRDPISQRIFMESLYFQAKFWANEYEAIYVDEFKIFFLETRKYRGWEYIVKHSGVCESNSVLAFSVIISFSELHFMAFLLMRIQKKNSFTFRLFLDKLNENKKKPVLIKMITISILFVTIQQFTNQNIS